MKEIMVPLMINYKQAKQGRAVLKLSFVFVSYHLYSMDSGPYYTALVITTAINVRGCRWGNLGKTTKTFFEVFIDSEIH